MHNCLGFVNCVLSITSKNYIRHVLLIFLSIYIHLMYKFDWKIHVHQRCSLLFGCLENDQVAGSAYGEESYFVRRAIYINELLRLISIFPTKEIEL